MKKFSIKKLLPNLAPLFFSLSFVFVLFYKNIDQIPLRDIYFPLVFAVFVCDFFLIISRLFLRGHVKGSIFASISIIVFYSFSGILTLVPMTVPFGTTRGTIALVISALAFIVVFVILGKIKRNLITISNFLAITAVFALIIPLARITFYETHRVTQTTVVSPLALPHANSTKDLPDFYFILPEDYSSSAVLKKYFNYSNKPFESFLKNHGFYVASQSTSNYPKSFLSVASTLNMEYLDYLSKNHSHSSDQGVVAPLINDNNVLRFLKPLGYSYFQMGSWWELTTDNPDADENFTLEKDNGLGVDGLSYTMLKSTTLRPLMSRLSADTILTQSDADKRRRILYQFQELPQVAKMSGPKFVFLHLIAPHDPYVFDQSCNPIDIRQTKNQAVEVNYVNQVNCIDTKMEMAIDQIQTISKHKAVILIQTDEGAPFLANEVNPADNWQSAGSALLQEKFPIFAAFYFPGSNYKQLYPQITPVNSFRVIFNSYFKTNLPRLPDKNFIFLDSQHLYDFADVTSQAR